MIIIRYWPPSQHPIIYYILLYPNHAAVSILVPVSCLLFRSNGTNKTSDVNIKHAIAFFIRFSSRLSTNSTMNKADPEWLYSGIQPSRMICFASLTLLVCATLVYQYSWSYVEKVYDHLSTLDKEV